MKKETFVGREKELEKLASLKKKSSASIAVIRGRRRIGKSRLIQQFAKGQHFFSFAGIPPTKGVRAQQQRDVFARQLCKQVGLSNISSEDWSTLFSLLARYTETGPVIILLDEISWMGSKDPSFLGKLKNAWDLEFKENPNLILILCGSVSTWIEKNILSSTGFFGRISLSMKIEELPLHSCKTLLLNRGFRGSDYEIFKLLGVLGGVPWYLEQIQSGLNADQNIRNLCFLKEGPLFNEFENIFHDIFQKRSSTYRPIVDSLANGPKEFNALCKELKMAKSGTISTYLEDLVESGFVRRDFTWWVKSGSPSILSQYRLSDNYLRFYLKCIAPNRNRILRDGFENQNISSMPAWLTMMGLQFENLVLNNRKIIWKKLGIAPEDIVADNPYFQKGGIQKKGCQIDYLIQTRYHTLFACEIKFSLNPITGKVIDEMKEKMKNIALPKRFSCWPVLIHVNGVEECILSSGYFSEVIDFSSFLEGVYKVL